MMKTVLVCVFVLIAAQVSAQSLQDCYNNIGIFNSPAVDLETLSDADVNHNGVGLFTVYVVLINPYNENTGELISTVGGFEFRLELPDGLFVTPNLPPGVCMCGEFPDFYCPAELPVTNNQCALISLDIGTFTQDPGVFFITPVSDPAAQSIPGDIAVTDAGDDYSLSRATPISLDFAVPLYGMNLVILLGPDKNIWDDCWVVPTTSTTWGSIKAMYR